LDIQYLLVPAVIVVSVTSFALLVITNWRMNIILLAVQFVGIFILLTANWSLQLASTNLLSGLIAGTVLGMARYTSRPVDDDKNQVLRTSPRKQFLDNIGLLSAGGILFQLLAAGLVILAVIYITPILIIQLPELSSSVGLGGLILTGMGLLKLGFTDTAFGNIIGLLTTFSGFIVIYSSIEDSVLVIGLLSVVLLGISLVGAYLLVISNPVDQA
jgi:hypothetical protein